MESTLRIYIAFGAIIGLFFGGVWQGIAAMALIYIAQRIDQLIKALEYRR